MYQFSEGEGYLHARALFEYMPANMSISMSFENLFSEFGSQKYTSHVVNRSNRFKKVGR